MGGLGSGPRPSGLLAATERHLDGQLEADLEARRALAKLEYWEATRELRRLRAEMAQTAA